MSPEYQRIDRGVVPHTPSRLPAVIEDIAHVSAFACILLTAVSSNILWLAPTLPMIAVAMICQKVRSK